MLCSGDSKINITNSYGAFASSPSYSYTRAVANSIGTFTGVYYDKQSCNYNGTGAGSATGLTTGQMKEYTQTYKQYSGWDFLGVWYKASTSSSSGMPKLFWANPNFTRWDLTRTKNRTNTNTLNNTLLKVAKSSYSFNCSLIFFCSSLLKSVYFS